MFISCGTLNCYAAHILFFISRNSEVCRKIHEGGSIFFKLWVLCLLLSKMGIYNFHYCAILCKMQGGELECDEKSNNETIVTHNHKKE